MNAPTDQTQQFRRPASGGFDQYLRPLTLPGITVGVVPRPLTLQRTSAFMVLVQASNGNGGIVYLGGPNVDAASGIELIAGTGFLFATSPNAQQQQLTGGLSFGLTPMQQISGQAGKRDQSFLLYDMADIWIAGSAAGQTVRVMYFVPVR